jgi:hypothetical protein
MILRIFRCSLLFFKQMNLDNPFLINLIPKLFTIQFLSFQRSSVTNDDSWFQFFFDVFDKIDFPVHENAHINEIHSLFLHS